MIRTITVALLFASVCYGAQVPSFSLMVDPPTPIPDGVPIPKPVLRITFPDGLEDDFVELNYNNIIPQSPLERAEDVDPCLFDGYLKNEKDVYVTVTGCPETGTFNIQFRSQRLSHDMFKVIDGKVESVESVFGKRTLLRGKAVAEVNDKVVLLPEELRVKTKNEINRDAVNPKGYILKIKIRYDESFKAKFGDDSVNTIRRVMLQAQNIWKWPSLGSSLTFNIDPSVDPIAGKYVASTDLAAVAKFSTDDSFNSNVYFAFRDNQPGTVGIAYFQATCGSANYRTSLNEYFQDDMTCGKTVAHEIGHNLGLDHDFINDPANKRTDSKGNACSGVGGVMDYYGTVNKWSTCSVEDFTKYIGSVTPFCLTGL